MHYGWIKGHWEAGDPRSRTGSSQLRGSSTVFCNPLMRLCQSSLTSLPCATWNTAHGESWWSHFLIHKTLQTYLYYFPCMPVTGCLPRLSPPSWFSDVWQTQTIFSKVQFCGWIHFKILCSGQTYKWLFFFIDFSIQWVKAEKTYLEARAVCNNRHTTHTPVICRLGIRTGPALTFSLGVPGPVHR